MAKDDDTDDENPKTTPTKGKGLKGKVTPIEDDDQDDVPSTRPRAPTRDIVAPEFEITKLHNGQLEFLSLIRVVADKDLQSRLWPRYSEDHFASEVPNAIYQRLHTLQVMGRDWPSLASLAMDPALPPAAQQQIRMVVARIDKGFPLTHGEVDLGNGTKVPVEQPSDFETFVFDLLEAYRITRQGTEAFVTTVKEIADEAAFDPLRGPEIVERAATAVLQLRGREALADATLIFGHQSSAEDNKKRRADVRKLFSKKKRRFRTGIEIFDEKSGGFQPGEVILLGAGTGSGKTAMQLTLMTNMARLGTSTAMLQLELTKEQVMERLGANLANIDSEAVRTGKLTPQQQENIDQALEEFHEEISQTNTRMMIHSPSVSTVQDCEFFFKQYPYGVWFIDYVNLLKLSNDGDGHRSGEDWTRLSDIVKEFKRIAKKHRVAIVLAVQVNINNDNGAIEIRYAKAMKEHADVVIVWNLTKEAREEGVVWFQHMKARQYEPFDWPMRIALHYCRFESFSKADMVRREERKLGGKKKVRDVATEDQASPFKKKTKPAEVPVKGPETSPSPPPVDDDGEPLDDPAGKGQNRKTAFVDDDAESYSGYDA